jgi:hypothetical protein
MSTITTPELMCWIGAYACMIFSFVSYVVQHRKRETRGRLALHRLVEKGIDLIAALDSAEGGDRYIPAVEIQQWWRECRQTVKDCFPLLEEHVADLDDPKPTKLGEQSRLMLKRIQELLQ